MHCHRAALDSRRRAYARRPQLAVLAFIAGTMAFAGMLLIGHNGRAQTSLVIDVDPTLVLSCQDTITFTFTPAEVAQLVTGGSSSDVAITTPTATTSVTASGSGWDVTITGLSTTLAVPSLRTTKNVLDICEIRVTALFAGNYTATTSLSGDTVLRGPGNSIVRVTSVATRPGYSNGSFSTTTNIPWWIFWFLGGRVTLDFQAELDLSGAGQSGLHTADSSGTFTVTAAAF